MMAIFINPENEEVCYKNFGSSQSFFRLSQDELEKNTLTNYEGLLTKFSADFGQWEVSSVTTEEVLTFLRFD